MRMIVSQIVRVRPIQPPIPFASITLLVLHHDTQQQHHTRRRTHPQQTQTRAIANCVMRRLISDEDVTRDDAAAVTEANHHGARDGALVMARHVVLDPGERHGLTDVAAADDDEDSEVAHADCDGVLAEQDDVSNRCNTDPQNTETEPMARAVCTPSYHQRNNSRNNKHRDTAHLRRLRSVSEIANDSRREETRSIPSVDNADVHNDAAVDFPVPKDAFARWAVEAVHFRVGDVDAQTGDEQSSFVVVEEFGGFGPVWDQPFGDDGDAAGYDALAVVALVQVFECD